jgi:uncharacterized protein YidB (DUF937 family)
MASLGSLLNDLLGGSRRSKGGLDLGGILGGLLGGSGSDTALMMALLPIVSRMLGSGGLKKLLKAFAEQGLAKQADSWIGTGRNLPVSADQVIKVIGGSKIEKIAKELGVSQKDAAGALATLLPAVIDHVSPEGKVPSRIDVWSTLRQLRKAAG